MDPEFIEGLEEQLNRIIQETATAPQSIYESIVGFYHAVDWTEPWLIGLMVFHVSIFILALVTRDHWEMQTGLYLFLVLLAFGTETFNTWAAENWRLFARQNYFDKNGFFLTSVFCFPLLLVLMLQLILVLRSSVGLMKELRKKKMQGKGGTKPGPVDAVEGAATTSAVTEGSASTPTEAQRESEETPASVSPGKGAKGAQRRKGSAKK